VSSYREVLERLLARQNLSEDEAAELLRHFAGATLPAATAGALLIALRAKGVTADELRGFAGAMRELALRPNLAMASDAIDIVGTGGDASGSLNLSTGAALLAAASGLPVIKHGNRSISSRSGSADLLEALGFTMPLDEMRAARCFRETGFTFLFAPYYHPSMKAIAPVRAALGVRTIFNLLGPLMNPARPRYHLIGAHDSAAAQLIAETLAGLAGTRAWVIHGACGWDEPTPLGEFQVFDVRDSRVTRRVIDPAALGFARCRPEDLAGGDGAANLAALRAVFDRRDVGAHRDALLLQSGMALHIAGRVPSLDAGIATIGEVLASGRAQDWLARLESFARSAA
jgi:anthranilate phosphoribosyltransferase